MSQIDNAIKKADVIIVMGGDGVHLAHEAKAGLLDLKEEANVGDLLFIALAHTCASLLARYSDPASIEHIAATEIAETVRACRETYNESNKPVLEPKQEDATIEDIQHEMDAITSSLSFGLSRLAGGRVDDLSINAFKTVLEKNTPAIAEKISLFINKNADENDALIDQITEAGHKLDSRGKIIEQLTSEKSQLSEQLRATSADLERKESIITGMQVTARDRQREIDNFKAMDPQGMKKRLATSKLERAELKTANVKMRKEVATTTAAMDFLRGQYAKLDANYLVMTETHKDIVSSMERLTGSTLEGNLAYQRSDESDDYAWIHIFYLQKFLPQSEKSKPVGQRNVNTLSFYLEAKTSYGVNVDFMLSEWGYVTYPIIDGMTDWFGANMIAAAQEMYEESIKVTAPDIWARFEYLRSLKLEDLQGVPIKAVTALKAVGVVNVGQAGSNTPERLKALSGITITEAKRLLAACQPYFDQWVEEHGALDVHASRQEDGKAQVDATMAKCLRASVAKLRDEVPTLFARVEMSLADQFAESLGECRETEKASG